MPRRLVAVGCLVVLAVGGPCLAQDGNKAEATGAAGPPSLWDRDTLTNRWFGLGEKLEDKGVTISLGLTQVYQLNLHGGISRHRRAGRCAGSFDLEGEFDLEKLFGLKGGKVYAAAEGSWSAGLDASSIGSVVGNVNADAAGDRSIDLTELWYEQAFLDGRLRVRVGKIDLTGGFECGGCPVAFDGSAYANDEAGQFLNAALVNNPTIPFPDKGLAVVVYGEPLEWWYVAAAAADAQADARETGFNTAFHDEDFFFSIFETGVVPTIPSPNGELRGAYRIGFWHDPQRKDRHAGGTKRDDVGIYLSCDQRVWKENKDPEDGQGLGVFGRWGWADKHVADIKCFWSLGCQYQGLIPTRDDDVIGLGYAQGTLVWGTPSELIKSTESVMELYYSAAVAPWLNVSPSLQYICNPGGVSGVKDAFVLGIRVQMAF